ncbi:efflux RND transporter periplasmic adaptor subunit [Flavisphingomonas formosensis]|uniref:efflux RND transporter periplasmic adaptor subunit n=1 Tax=Flavisphingomonas formosensis TaxID=861534 RepID=UPI0012FCDF35|nr:efflux RND transporter periplasmic adaptor subunit [Sphingomonas formosensis]
MPTPTRLFQQRSATLLAPLSALLLLAACGHAEADPRTEPPLVRISTAGPAASGDDSYTGIIASRIQSNLGFRIAGKVIERLVDTGQVVRRGQPLMRIDATDYMLATRQSEGSVAAARATAVQTAADEARFRDLVAAGAVSASQYDKAKADADAARAQLAALQAQARVAHNEAGYTLLVADADGTVVETLAEPGQVVTAGQPVVRLAHAGPREATMNLPETERPAIGSTARATLFNGSSSIARLRQLSDAADPQTRTYEARYVLEGAAAAAPLGSTVTLSIGGKTGPASGYQVPLGALHDGGAGPGVWVLGAGDKVHWRRVQVAAMDAESATVTAGLKPGERFVALGAHMLHDGQQVRPALQVASR